MKVPEFLFPLINPMMTLMLRSPLHGLMSSSLMLVRFQGRRSGREFVTPVRYLRAGDEVHCFTAKHTKWWPNMRSEATVQLTVAGRESTYRMRAILNDAARIKPALEAMLRAFPQDAPYFEMSPIRNGEIPQAELDRATAATVFLVATRA